MHMPSFCLLSNVGGYRFQNRSMRKLYFSKNTISRSMVHNMVCFMVRNMVRNMVLFMVRSMALEVGTLLEIKAKVF